MTIVQLMAMKPTDRVTDRLSGAEFVVSELTPILAQMLVMSHMDDAKDFADRFEVSNDL